MKKKSLRKQKMKIFVIVLIVCFLTLSGCQTTSPPKRTVALLPAPVPAESLPVKFDDYSKLGGLLLSYDNYRNLETNIINTRAYIKELKNQLAYYRERYTLNE